MLLSEIKRLLHVLNYLADSTEGPAKITEECLIENLHKIECKAGCVNCGLNELLDKLDDCFKQRHYDSGKC